MFTFSRTKLATLFAGLTLVAAGNLAVADTKIRGVVKQVNYETNSLTVTTDKTGRTNTYSFPGAPKIDVNGQKLSNMSALQPGQNVILKFKTKHEQKTFNVTKGEILEVNREQNTALIRPANGGNPRVVKFPEGVSIAGLHSGAQAEDLQKGHLVTLKYSAR